MPVTLTLTDEQALDIVSQVSDMLKQRGYQGSNETLKLDESRLKPAARIIKKIDSMPKGHVFSTNLLAHEFGVTSTRTSMVLSKLRKVKVVEMVQRGTWKKIA